MKKGYRICFVEIKHTSKCISNPGNEKRSMLQLKRNSQGEKTVKIPAGKFCRAVPRHATTQRCSFVYQSSPSPDVHGINKPVHIPCLTGKQYFKSIINICL